MLANILPSILTSQQFRQKIHEAFRRRLSLCRALNQVKDGILQAVYFCVQIRFGGFFIAIVHPAQLPSDFNEVN